jgi:hypothetical protein
MSSERQRWAEITGATDLVLELSLMLGAPVTDAEIDQLCEPARSVTIEAAPGRPYAVSRTAEIRGFPPVVVEDPSGRYGLHPDISAFAAAAFETERRRRRRARDLHALEDALADLPTRYLRVIQEMCAPPRPQNRQSMAGK